MSLKTERIASDINRELAAIMLLEAKDETLKHITITGVVVSSDLSYAKVYYTYMGDEDLKDVKENLKVAAPYLRTVLASRIEVRHTPELQFVFDKSVEYGQNIERIIKKLNEEDKKED